MKVLVVCFVCTIVSSLANVVFEKEESMEEYMFRINGGSLITNDHLYPWVAYIKVKDSENEGEYIRECTGCIINNRTVLTAAYCVMKEALSPGDIEIWLGNKDLSLIERPITPLNFTIHPDFKNNTNAYNIAILKLGSPVLEVENDPVYIRYIDLPTETLLKMNDTFAEAAGTIAGFGETLEGNGPEGELRIVHVEVLNQETCKNKMREIHIQLMESNICTHSYGGRKGACRYDHGAPLTVIIPSSKLPILIGIMSYYDEKCQTDYPMLFTRMGSKGLLKWIADNGGPSVKK